MFRLAVVGPSANLIDKNAEKIKTQFTAAVKVLLFQPIPKTEQPFPVLKPSLKIRFRQVKILQNSGNFCIEYFFILFRKLLHIIQKIAQIPEICHFQRRRRNFTLFDLTAKIFKILHPVKNLMVFYACRTPRMLAVTINIGYESDFFSQQAGYPPKNYLRKNNAL